MKRLLHVYMFYEQAGVQKTKIMELVSIVNSEIPNIVFRLASPFKVMFVHIILWRPYLLLVIQLVMNELL